MKYSPRSLMLAATPGEEFAYWFMSEWAPILINAACLICLAFLIVGSLNSYRQGRRQEALLLGIVTAIILVFSIVSLVLTP